MSFANDKDSERSRRAGHPKSESQRRRKSESTDIGQALRKVYDRTVNEAIPSEMLDLLGKLD